MPWRRLFADLANLPQFLSQSLSRIGGEGRNGGIRSDSGQGAKLRIALAREGANHFAKAADVLWLQIDEIQVRSQAKLPFSSSSGPSEPTSLGPLLGLTMATFPRPAHGCVFFSAPKMASLVLLASLYPQETEQFVGFRAWATSNFCLLVNSSSQSQFNFRVRAFKRGFAVALLRF